MALRMPVGTPAVVSTAARRIRAVHSAFVGVRVAPVVAAPARATSRPLSVQAALKVGDNMTEFPDYKRKLKSADGKMVALSDFKGRKNVVLFFYPKAETPGCTKEACKFRDEYEAFKKAGAEVIGISGDPVAAQKAFASKYGLPFTILSDEGDGLRKALGVPGDMFGMLPGRQTYVISKQGKVALIFNSQLDVEAHVTKALDALAKL